MSKNNETLKELLLIKTQALYDVETQITKALPDMIKAASDENLKEAFEEHLKKTEMHVTRLEQAFEELEEKPKKLKVEAIRGLVDDATWVIKQRMSREATDAALIGAATYVENYEKAGYKAAIRWANETDSKGLVSLFQATLEEEEEADEKLKKLAEDHIDSKVASE